MKPLLDLRTVYEIAVAPRAGAWIETPKLAKLGKRLAMSLLAQERGLKRLAAIDPLKKAGSLLAQERGLKP